MSEQFYIRVRGRVQGPFDGEKLRQLARRGQFSRMHEVSPDGQQWQSAKERPELFSAPAQAASTTPRAAFQATSTPGSVEASHRSASGQTQSGATDSVASEAWYYVDGGKEEGPIDFAALYELLATRRLAPETEVWRNGMSEWVPAHTIPGLVANAISLGAATSHQSSAVAGGKSTEVPPEVIRPLLESRPWVTFIGIIGFIYAAAMMGIGLLVVIAGSRAGTSSLVANGLGNMLMSVVVAVGAWLLVNYAGWISRLDRTRRTESLRSALVAVKTFWVYVGIVLIVLLTLLVILGIVMFAMIGSIPSFK